MISILRSIFMPDDSLPPIDKAIVAFFEIVAFALGWIGIERLLTDGTRLSALPVLAACILISYAGFKWLKIKPYLLCRTSAYCVAAVGVLALLVSVGLLWYRHSNHAVRAVPERQPATSQNTPTPTSTTAETSATSGVVKNTPGKKKRPLTIWHQPKATNAPCPKESTAILLMDKGNFEDTKINQGPCSNGIIQMHGSQDSTFKRTEINQGVQPQDNGQDAAPSNDPNQASGGNDGCSISNVEFKVPDGMIGFGVFGPGFKGCNLSFTPMPDKNAVKDQPASGKH
jgi:hypothetical protein